MSIVVLALFSYVDLEVRVRGDHPLRAIREIVAASRDDIEMTREVKAAAEALGIAIHYHLVIGRKGHARRPGLLS
jgi:hypothetical protein